MTNVNEGLTGNVNIPGALHSSADDNIVVYSGDIFDDVKKENQRNINNDLETRVSENKQLIDAKVVEVGAVPWDITPTKESTNGITSGGVYAHTIDTELIDGINIDTTTDIATIYKGDKGDPFTYEDFTTKQLDDIKESVYNATAQDISIINYKDGFPIICSSDNPDEIFTLGEVVKDKYINSSNSWATSSGAKGLLISYSPEKFTKLVVRARNSSCRVAFLKTKDTITLCADTSLVTFSSLEIKELDVPRDCKYIYFDILRDGSYLLNSIAYYTEEAYNKKQSSPSLLSSGEVDLSIYNAYNLAGSPYAIEVTNLRCLFYVPCTNVSTLKITVNNGYRVATTVSSKKAESAYDVALTSDTNIYTTSTSGNASGVPLTAGESATFNIDDKAKTFIFWIRREDNGVIQPEEVAKSFVMNIVTKEDAQTTQVNTINSLSKLSKTAPFYIIDAPTSVIEVNTIDKTILIPNSACVSYGENQSKAWAFVGGAKVSYDVTGIGTLVRMVFNPTKTSNDEKFYLKSREVELTNDEYFVFYVLLDPIRIGLPNTMYSIDGIKGPSIDRESASSIIYYDGEKLELPIKKKNALSIQHIAQQTLQNNVIFNGELYYAQGMAIYNNYLFRLCYNSNGNICQVYNITTPQLPIYVNTFKLGYTGSSPHCNACQFGNEITDTGFPLLYIRNGEDHACVVEKISLSSSSVSQTIKVDYTNIFSSGGGEGNTIIGDDDYIWYFGANQSKIYIAKFIKPDINQQEVTLTSSDIVDAWESNFNDSYLGTEFQGGKVKGGKLYFLLGENGSTNRLHIYDTESHKLLTILPLNSITEECEDLDIYEQSIFISVSSHFNGFYEITDINN